MYTYKIIARTVIRTPYLYYLLKLYYKQTVDVLSKLEFHELNLTIASDLCISSKHSPIS